MQNISIQFKTPILDFSHTAWEICMILESWFKIDMANSETATRIIPQRHINQLGTPIANNPRPSNSLDLLIKCTRSRPKQYPKATAKRPLPRLSEYILVKRGLVLASVSVWNRVAGESILGGGTVIDFECNVGKHVFILTWDKHGGTVEPPRDDSETVDTYGNRNSTRLGQRPRVHQRNGMGGRLGKWNRSQGRRSMRIWIPRFVIGKVPKQSEPTGGAEPHMWKFAFEGLDELVVVQQPYKMAVPEEARAVGKDTANANVDCAASPCKNAFIVERAHDLQLKTLKCFFPLPIKHHIQV